MNASDNRPSRYVGGERIDAAISDLNFEKRKISLSIKLLEELMNEKAIKEHDQKVNPRKPTGTTNKLIVKEKKL